MDRPLGKYQVRSPQHCLGHVLGELSRIGSWLDGLSDLAPVQTVYVRIPLDVVPEFERWLSEVSRGEGSIVGDDSANDEDA
jgi:hypothetical protein